MTDWTGGGALVLADLETIFSLPILVWFTILFANCSLKFIAATLYIYIYIYEPYINFSFLKKWMEERKKESGQLTVLPWYC